MGIYLTVGMVPGCVCGVPLAMSIEHSLTAPHFSYDSRKTGIWGHLPSAPMSPHVSFPCVAPLGMSLRGREWSGFPLFNLHELFRSESSPPAHALPPLYWPTPIPLCVLHPFCPHALCSPNLSLAVTPSLLEQSTKPDHLLFTLFVGQKQKWGGKIREGALSHHKEQWSAQSTLGSKAQ